MVKYKNLESRLFMMGKNYKSRRKNRRWIVSIDRPEEIYGDPSLYYTDEEIEKYARCGGMRRAQEKIAYRIIELLDLEKKAKLLDLGCGVGYTTSIYQSEGYDVTGLDILPKMLQKAQEKGLKVIKGDMRELPNLFDKGSFDAVVSASALQWLKQREDITKVSFGINYVLRDRGRLVIQFYPKSEEEMMHVARIFKRNGFGGEIIVDNPENPKKRTIYLVMEKN
jgi:cyclopropane fatty-acyl-phospholipid synthase-like methyltransferase